MEIFACPNRRFLGNYLSKRQAGRVLAKSLQGCMDGLTTEHSFDSQVRPKKKSFLFPVTLLNKFLFKKIHTLKFFPPSGLPINLKRA